jgi:hypothetical protein
MKIDAIFYWLGTTLFVVGLGISSEPAGFVIGLGVAIMLFSLNSRRQR